MFIFRVFLTVFFTASPEFFGSLDRIRKLHDLSEKTEARAGEVDAEIAAERIKNPFESAAAKSAMAQSVRKSRQIQQRYANMLGAGTNPEALVAAQGATQDAIAGTAGDIATGAEALKSANINTLQNRKMAYQNQAAQQEQASINEIGSGWKDFFTMTSQIGSTVGNLSKVI